MQRLMYENMQLYKCCVYAQLGAGQLCWHIVDFVVLHLILFSGDSIHVRVSCVTTPKIYALLQFFFQFFWGLTLSHRAAFDSIE